MCNVILLHTHSPLRGRLDIMYVVVPGRDKSSFTLRICYVKCVCVEGWSTAPKSTGSVGVEGDAQETIVNV